MEIIKSKYITEGCFESLIGGRAENQDSVGFSETPHGLLVTVCDGMGGATGGKTASLIAVNTIVKYIIEADESESQKDKVVNAIKKANDAIIDHTSNHPELKGMGTTATAILIDGNSAIVAHVGDSRVYQMRGHKKIFRTFDHSMVFDLVRNKVITEEQARLSAQSNVITRALGIKNELDVDCTELSYDKGDKFALCTDGIHGTVPEKYLVDCLTSNKKTSTIVSNITRQIDNLGKQSGNHHDNLTLALFTVNSNSKFRNIMERKLKIALLASLGLLLISFIINIVYMTRKSETKIKINDTVFSIENEDKKIDSVNYIIQKEGNQYIATPKIAQESNADEKKNAKNVINTPK